MNDDHEWPADLSEDAAACEKCGLLYSQWDEDLNRWCTK